MRQPLTATSAALANLSARTTLRWTLLAASCVAVAGCAFDPGDPFGQATVSLFGSYEQRADRRAPDGFEKLDTDYQIRLSAIELRVDTVELLATAPGTTAAGFDPANPPAGYGTCHAGHCHADDGSLVPYEQIAAELARSVEGGLVTAVSLPGDWMDLRDGVALSLCAEGCPLAEGTLALVRVTGSRFRVTGEVRDSRADPRIAGTVGWQADVLLPVSEESTSEDSTASEASVTPLTSAGVFTAPLEVPVDDEHAPWIDLALDLMPDTALFDGVDFAVPVAAEDGTIDLTVPSAMAARERIRANFGAVVLGTWVARSDP